MTVGRALILGGTGMLAGVAEALTGEGWHVVLPSRRYSPIAAARRARQDRVRQRLRTLGRTQPVSAETHAAETTHVVSRADASASSEPDPERPGRAIWVEADWARPRVLARKADKALGGRADLLVAWVHESYRQPLLRAIEPLLVPHGPVVEARDGDTISSITEPDPLLAGHPVQQVVLGEVSQQRGPRPLSHAEIVDGVLAAIRRALAGHASSLHQIGRPRPLNR